MKRRGDFGGRGNGRGRGGNGYDRGRGDSFRGGRGGGFRGRGGGWTEGGYGFNGGGYGGNSSGDYGNYSGGGYGTNYGGGGGYGNGAGGYGPYGGGGDAYNYPGYDGAGGYGMGMVGAPPPPLPPGQPPPAGGQPAGPGIVPDTGNAYDKAIAAYITGGAPSSSYGCEPPPAKFGRGSKTRGGRGARARAEMDARGDYNRGVRHLMEKHELRALAADVERRCSAVLPPQQRMLTIPEIAAGPVHRLFFVIKGCTVVPQPDHVTDMFNRFGNLFGAHLMKDKNYGYARYSSEESARDAAANLDGCTFNEGILKVEYADPDQFDDYKKSRDGDRDEGPNDDNEDEDDHIGLHGDNDGEGAKRGRYQGPHQLS